MPNVMASPESLNAVPVPTTKLALPDVILVRPTRFGDDRGFFSETYHQAKWSAGGIGCTFVQDNHSLSRPAGTVRGLHYQLAPHAQDKLVRVVRGRILDVAVDIRRSSPTFGRHVSAELTASGGEQMFVPAGFAHGFVTLDPDTEVVYKCSGEYRPEAERGIRWNDPALGIDWRIETENATLSGRDAVHPYLAEQPDLFA
jgi:dTDP-4-dehydrorhamnose 3,5-epimerase